MNDRCLYVCSFLLPVVPTDGERVHVGVGNLLTEGYKDLSFQAGCQGQDAGHLCSLSVPIRGAQGMHKTTVVADTLSVVFVTQSEFVARWAPCFVVRTPLRIRELRHNWLHHRVGLLSCVQQQQLYLAAPL